VKRNAIITSLLLGVTANPASSSSSMNNWSKLLEQSDKSRLRAEQARLPKLPVTAPISSIFGPRLHPITGQHRLHKGIDLAAPEGEIFSSVAEGKVIESKHVRGFGKTILIDHGNGITTRYAHASELLVKKGDIVLQNQAIGRVGQTGLVTGPHLHFEVEMDGQHIDPKTFLAGAIHEPPIMPSNLETQTIEDIVMQSPIETVEPLEEESPVAKPIIDTATYLTTTRSLWSISYELSQQISYTSLHSIMDFIVDINPDSFPTGNKDYRLAHVPLYIPNQSILLTELPQYIKTDKSIWLIAKSLQSTTDTSASIYQIMFAIKSKNSRAFIDDNIHHRLASIPLILPTPDEYEHAMHDVALASFRADNLAIQILENS
jgi:hypothetical protein